MERFDITQDKWDHVAKWMTSQDVSRITNWQTLCEYIYGRYGDFNIKGSLEFQICHDMKISCDISSDKCTICNP